MSNRVFKKVYGDADLKLSPDSDDEHPIAFGNAKKSSNPARNPFELLESEPEKDDGIEENEANNSSGDSSKIDDEASQSSSKKKKKKKKASKNKKLPMSSGSDFAIDTEKEEGNGLRQRHKATRTTVKSIESSKESHQNSKSTAVFEELFKIDSRFLNSEFELKRIFGAKVINYERSKQGQRRVYRHSKLVMPKEQWPSVSGSGISMAFLESRDGNLFFKFEHNPHYINIQKKFMQAVDTMNPENIVNIMKLYPYHVDSHIQLSDMAKAAEDMQVAAELIEGAVHCLENAFHVRFIVSNPLCRLEYKYQENRPFFILLFKHLTFVGLRACHRTALELCKRLLCLDPEADPLCVTLMIDFYALKAGEAQWFVNLFNYWEKSRNLDQLPNFSYSAALGYHLLATSAEGVKSSSSDSTDELEKRADTLIQHAILMFPSVLLPLLDKLGVQIDSRAKHHTYFNSHAQNSQSRSLKLLCDLYVLRTHHVWRESTILGWLEKNVHVVLDKVDAKDPIVTDYENKRKRRYQATTPRNILRHVLLTDNKDLTLNLPSELSKEPILSYDPLPPPDSINVHIREPVAPTVSSSRRPGLIHMLLSSVVNDLNAQPNAENLLDVGGARAQADGQGEPRPIAIGAGLQESVTVLLDAMRDLLTNVNPGGEADAADGEYSGSEIEPDDVVDD